MQEDKGVCGEAIMKASIVFSRPMSCPSTAKEGNKRGFPSKICRMTLPLFEQIFFLKGTYPVLDISIVRHLSSNVCFQVDEIKSCKNDVKAVLHWIDSERSLEREQVSSPAVSYV